LPCENYYNKFKPDWTLTSKTVYFRLLKM